MITLVLAIALAGQDPDLPADCADAVTTLEVNACAAADLEVERARMDEYFQAALNLARSNDLESARHSGGALPNQEAAYLDASQRAWSAYAEMACQSQYERYSAGTIRTAVYLGCMQQLTHERTRAIWRGHLNYPDSTPPILPEPVEPAAAR